MKGLSLFILLMVIVTVQAQPSGGGPLTPTPIGFSELLILGGVGIVAKKKLKTSLKFKKN